jgi:hypothetical protein
MRRFSLILLSLITLAFILGACYRGDPGYGLCDYPNDPSCSQAPPNRNVRGSVVQVATIPVNVATQVTGVMAQANGGTGASSFVGGGWVQATSVTFVGATDPGLSANGTYTLAGITGVQRENAANDRVAMAIVAGGISISPKVSQYLPSSNARTAPLLAFPLSSLITGVVVENLTALRFMIRISSSSQSAFDNGHGVDVGIDDNGTNKYAVWCRQGTDGGGSRQWSSGYQYGSLAGTQNSSASAQVMSTGVFVMVCEIPAVLSGNANVVNSYADTVAAWPNLGTLTPTNASAQILNTSALQTTNPTPVSWLSHLFLTIAADSPTSVNDAYTTVVSDMRIDYRL